VGGTDFTS